MATKNYDEAIRLFKEASEKDPTQHVIFANMAEARHLTHAAWDQILTLGKAPVAILPAICRQIEAAQAANDPAHRQG